MPLDDIDIPYPQIHTKGRGGFGMGSFSLPVPRTSGRANGGFEARAQQAVQAEAAAQAASDAVFAQQTAMGGLYGTPLNQPIAGTPRIIGPSPNPFIGGQAVAYPSPYGNAPAGTGAIGMPAVQQRGTGPMGGGGLGMGEIIQDSLLPPEVQAAQSSPDAAVKFNVAFNEGFQFGYNAATGQDLPPLTKLPGEDPEFDAAFQAGYNAGYGSGGGTYTANNDSTSGGPTIPMAGGAMGVNATQAAAMMDRNPKIAISFGGAATPGTPGYNTLSNLNFNPNDIMMAAGMSTVDPVGRLQNASNLYREMGRVGGSMVDASTLLTNMAYAGTETEFGAAVAVDPEQFYEVGIGVLTAAGASSAAINLFNEQMTRMYAEYGAYLLTSGTGNPASPFNAWLTQMHPEVVASWRG